MSGKFMGQRLPDDAGDFNETEVRELKEIATGAKDGENPRSLALGA
jgi:hypothetical protein